jgi:hypothetical protein
MLTIFKTTTGKELDIDRLKSSDLSKKLNLGSRKLLFDDGSEMYLSESEFQEVAAQVYRYYLARRMKYRFFNNTVFQEPTTKPSLATW